MQIAPLEATHMHRQLAIYLRDCGNSIKLITSPSYNSTNLQLVDRARWQLSLMLLKSQHQYRHSQVGYW